MAERFVALGNQVIICGRRKDKLEEVHAKHAALHIRISDLAEATNRVELASWVRQEFPNLDVLVNNAGIQERIDVSSSPVWPDVHREIAINFEAGVHMAMLLIPHLRFKERPAIINVTSGLAFVPRASVPVYSATKAAMRSFTLSLRHQLANTPIEVVEVIPPAVNTDLGGPGLHTFGVPLAEFADAIFVQLREGKNEIVYGFSEEASRATYEQRAAIFERMNA
jgi:uncharacterized oxidoreductase